MRFFLNGKREQGSWAWRVLGEEGFEGGAVRIRERERFSWRRARRGGERDGEALQGQKGRRGFGKGRGRPRR